MPTASSTPAPASSAPRAEPDGRGALLQVQRARLLAAIMAESAERGAACVTVAHVVSRAGVSRRTFYEQFEDREDCFLAAFDDAFARLARIVVDGDDPGTRWVQRLRAGLAATLAFMDAEPDAARLLVVGSLGAGPDALERRGRSLARVVEFVERGGGPQAPPPPLTAERVIGGALSIVHSRILRQDAQPLIELTAPLMGMLVLPYLGAAAARREQARPAPSPPAGAAARGGDPLRELRMRLTYRTVRVLGAVVSTPGGSNRQVAAAAGIGDQGQISKLLARLQNLGLIANEGAGSARGAPNSWVLTDRGREVQGAVGRG